MEGMGVRVGKGMEGGERKERRVRAGGKETRPEI